MYGENVLSPEEATRIASIRAEEIGCWASVYKGAGAVCDLRAGFTFKLQGHHYKQHNQSYLVTEITHRARNLDQSWGGRSFEEAERGNDADHGRQEAYYSNSFVAISSTVQFRPRRITAKPKIAGMVTGFVYTDLLDDLRSVIDDTGRYRVRLPFVAAESDTDQLTCYMRMAQPAAGAKYGAYFLLEPNAEVQIYFLNGDPDRPVIWGAVYNSASDYLMTNEGVQL